MSGNSFGGSFAHNLCTSTVSPEHSLSRVVCVGVCPGARGGVFSSHIRQTCFDETSFCSSVTKITGGARDFDTIPLILTVAYRKKLNFSQLNHEIFVSSIAHPCLAWKRTFFQPHIHKNKFTYTQTYPSI